MHDQLTRQTFSSPAQAVHARGQVVSLGTNPRYTADFRALACGEVSAARAALGMLPDQFGAWLGSLLGWAPMRGVVQAWEGGVAPPGDVVMAARACPAGAR
jgi:hypothetical protein